MMTQTQSWKFSKRSLAELEGVHPDLVELVLRALALSPVDFAVHDGIRTAEEQLALYKRGASRLDGTRRISRHQTGHAVDLVPFIGNRLLWEWRPLEDIATAMAAAARHCHVPLVWGGTWGRIDTLTGPVRKGPRGWDGPHFELDRRRYPA